MSRDKILASRFGLIVLCSILSVNAQSAEETKSETISVVSTGTAPKSLTICILPVTELNNLKEQCSKLAPQGTTATPDFLAELQGLNSYTNAGYDKYNASACNDVINKLAPKIASYKECLRTNCPEVGAAEPAPGNSPSQDFWNMKNACVINFPLNANTKRVRLINNAGIPYYTDKAGNRSADKDGAVQLPSNFTFP